jgi:hypothetical protein
MGIDLHLIKALRKYKITFQIFAFFNAFLIIVGLAAAIHYFQTNDVALTPLIWIGAATFLLGVVFPAFLITSLSKFLKNFMVNIEHQIAKWLAGISQGFNASEKPFKDFHFWINSLLVTLELTSENSKSFLAKVISQFSPIIREELRRSVESKGQRRKKTSAKTKP